jgi:hypothetical protein
MALTLSNTSIYQGGTTVDDSENLFVDHFRTAQRVRTSPWVYPGLNRGYVGLGSPVPGLTTYDTFPFAAAVTNAIPGGFFTRGADQTSSATNSETHGYSAGGGNAASPFLVADIIDRFPFAADYSEAVSVGELSVGRWFLGAHSSYTHGYCSGGRTAATPTVVRTNTIDKWPFAAETGVLATAVAGMGSALDQLYSHSSQTDGFATGGTPTTNTTIFRFPFAVDGIVSNVGNIAANRSAGASISSLTHAYNSGGLSAASAVLATIERFPFANPSGGSSNIGNLSVTRYQTGGASSLDFGYTMAGRTTTASPAGTNVIDRFPFATSTTNAVDVGDMTTTRWEVVGLQW